MPESSPTSGIGAVRRPASLRDVADFFVSPPVAAFAAGALLVLLLTAALHLGIDRTSWHLPIPSSFRLAVLAYALTQAGPLAVLVGALAAAAVGDRRLVSVATGLALSVVFFGLFVSWAMFWATGQFLDGDAAAFAMASPGAMLDHVLQLSTVLAVMVPAAAVALGFGLVGLVRRLHPTPVLVRAIILALLIGGAWLASSTNATAEEYLLGSELHMSHPEGGNGVAVGEFMAEMRENRSGATAYLRASWRRERLISEISPSVAVEWRDREPAWATAPPDRPWNVVLLIVESLRSDELAAYGSELPVMPSVDALSADAAVFLDHYAVASHSSYSAVSPVSSQYPLRDERLHIYPAKAHYPRVLLYDLLRPLGYRTAIISSQNERWGGMENFLASDNIDHFFHAETYRGPKYIPEEDGGFARFTETYGRAGKIDDRVTIDEAVSWLGRDTATPFFVYINLQNSHVPYPVPADAPTPFGVREPSFQIRFNYFPPDSADVVRGVYRNALHYVDAQIGRLIEHLKRSGQWDNTIFMVMGDHGQAFFEHGFAAHGNELYEELLRTPLIIRAPGLDPGPRSGLAQHVDVAPTVLDLLGLPPHPGFQGVSLIEPRRSFAYAAVQTPMANQYSISHESYKLVIDARRRTAVFRDLINDPGERFDWAERYPERVQQLRERLETWRGAQLRYYGNPMLQTSTYAPVLPEPRQLAEMIASGFEPVRAPTAERGAGRSPAW
jgi:arylsulfatase A-like enzyme